MQSLRVFLILFSLPLVAQHTPLTAPAPQMNGKPDLTGVWQAERTSSADFNKVLGDSFSSNQVDHNDFTKYVVNIFWGMRPGTEPVTPAVAPILQARSRMEPPTSRCLPAGVPVHLFLYDIKMIQSPREIVILSENGDPARQIYTDGRPLPKDPQPTWMGYSVGKWQGDTLAVETTGFTENVWLDGEGHPRSESMIVRENFHRRDFGHMDLDVTIEDPKYYTRPINLKTTFNLLPDSDVFEFVCENEKDRRHIH